jgi:hypothetical protein
MYLIWGFVFLKIHYGTSALGMAALFELFLHKVLEQKSECVQPDPKGECPTKK